MVFSANDHQDLDTIIEQRLGTSAQQIRSTEQLNAFRHTFSHYHLDIVPIKITLSTTPNVIHESGKGQWYNLNQPPKVGLAAPVQQILESLHYELKNL